MKILIISWGQSVDSHESGKLLGSTVLEDPSQFYLGAQMISHIEERIKKNLLAFQTEVEKKQPVKVHLEKIKE